MNERIFFLLKQTFSQELKFLKSIECLGVDFSPLIAYCATLQYPPTSKLHQEIDDVDGNPVCHKAARDYAP